MASKSTTTEEAFTRTTGLPATDNFVQRAIEHQRSTDIDYQLTDTYTDQELLTLLDEGEQAEQEAAQSYPGNEVGADGQDTEPTSRPTVPDRSAQAELRSDNEAHSRIQEISARLEEGTRRDSKKLGRFEKELEKRIAFEYAKENGLWVDDL